MSIVERLQEQVSDTPWPAILRQTDARALLAHIKARIALESHIDTTPMNSADKELAEWSTRYEELAAEDERTFAALAAVVEVTG